MPRYREDPSETVLKDDDVRKMFDKSKDLQEQALLSCLWITGARPSEILELRKENILITEDIVVFDLPTKKLQADGTRFVLKRRQLRIGRPHGLQMNVYLETVVKYAERLYHPEDPVFIYGRRWVIKVINRLGMQGIGKEVAPYHLRHSAVTREAARGQTIDQLMHFKGAKSIQSVQPYLHASPYDVVLPSIFQERVETKAKGGKAMTSPKHQPKDALECAECMDEIKTCSYCNKPFRHGRAVYCQVNMDPDDGSCSNTHFHSKKCLLANALDCVDKTVAL